MDVSNQASTGQLLMSPCCHPINSLVHPCSIPPLQTSPVTTPSVTASNARLPREPSRQFFVSRESFASERSSSTDSSPCNSVPTSPRSSTGAHTPVQHFVNALDTPPTESLTRERTHSTLSNSSSESVGAPTCVVCMDERRDIVLAPCQHSHCCLACFRRIQLNACPVCRTPVRSVVLLSTNLELPVSLVVPTHESNTRIATRASVTFGHPPLHEAVSYERPRPLISRRSAPVVTSFLREEVSSVHSRTTSASSVSVAQQAESSVRPIPRSQEAAFRRLRQTGTVQTASARSHHHVGGQGADRRHAFATNSSTASTARNITRPTSGTRSRVRDWENVALVGHDRKLMMSLAQKLIAAFPRPPNTNGTSQLRDKSTFVVNGKVLRLVIIECHPGDTAPQLALRVQRQSPKLVLMCADFFNISSFESIVRLDMEVLDYLNVACSWVLIKSLGIKRARRSNSVADADVRAAKHFLTSRRRCFLITVDVVQENTTMRKLGYYLYRAAYKGSTSAGSGSVMSDEHLAAPRRSWSFFCLRIDLPPKQGRVRHRFRASLLSFGRWLSN